MTHIATVKITGISPMAQCRPHNTPKLNKEAADAYEKRTFMNKLHTNKEGVVVVSPFTWKNAIAEGAKFLSLQIPGKGKSTYTKHFEAGVMVFEPTPIFLNGQPLTPEKVASQELFVPSDGISGSGKRVYKTFPVIDAGWETVVEYAIVDDTITSEVFIEVLRQTGSLIGIGSFRVRNRGIWGRFTPELISYSKMVA